MGVAFHISTQYVSLAMRNCIKFNIRFSITHWWKKIRNELLYYFVTIGYSIVWLVYCKLQLNMCVKDFIFLLGKDVKKPIKLILRRINWSGWLSLLAFLNELKYSNVDKMLFFFVVSEFVDTPYKCLNIQFFLYLVVASNELLKSFIIQEFIFT